MFSRRERIILRFHRKPTMHVPAPSRLALTLPLMFAFALPAFAWEFTDGAGKTITLDNPPERIVAFSSSAAGLLQFGIKPIAIFDDGTGSEQSLAGFDLEGIPYIETAYNELQPEALLALEPDLIVTEFFPLSRDYSGGEEMKPEGRFGSVAPIVGIEQSNSVVTIIENYGALAQALGADLDAGDISKQRAAFETARNRLQAAAAAKPGLRIVAAYPAADNLLLAVPAGAAELQDFISWGVNIPVPSVQSDDYWGYLSWENASTYPTDVVIVDDRTGPEMRENFLANPAAQLMPAVIAGQVGDWPAWWIRTYASYAEQLDKLTALIEASDVVAK
jgi:iron complex transport system substrate-binding protein